MSRLLDESLALTERAIAANDRAIAALKEAYTLGRLAGIREAAEVAWLQSKQGATHEQIRSAVLALVEGKEG